jgi:hypothetical protein
MSWRKIICWIRGHIDYYDKISNKTYCLRCNDLLINNVKVGITRTWLHPTEIEGSTKANMLKDLETQRIAEINRNRRTKFSNAEHFKRRQPTTARMLWKPNAKLEEEEN